MRRKKPRPRKEELRRKRIARERVRFLTTLTFSTYKLGLAKNDRKLIGLAMAYGNLARRLSRIHGIKTPLLDAFTCPNCKTVVFPGATVEIKGRIARCKICGYERTWRNTG